MYPGDRNVRLTAQFGLSGCLQPAVITHSAELMKTMLSRPRRAASAAPALLALFTLLAACGGGDSKDPEAYKETRPGAGSTVASAEVSASNARISYAHHAAQASATWNPGSVLATVNFNPASGQGSIAFPVLGGNQMVTTTNGYDSVSWSGPLTRGAYGLDGNALLGCNPAAATDAPRQAHIFISDSLTRIQDAAPIDELHGRTFNVVSCDNLAAPSSVTLKIGSSGEGVFSNETQVLSQNMVINMLNPEKWGGALLENGHYYSGRAYKYGVNGVTRYAIVLQTRAMSSLGGSVYHYQLALQP
ncbi:hypothetical protein [Caldimonas tepidiphila]|uniref:hypothetical protein n=1 Tax=Caldimonas tepidiphila TaxID=2315841 RepID=UPI0013008F7F|nr:hypothetical protein [Caldimonas tepidiphila]